MKTECTREQDVLDAVTAGRWPERCDAELKAHVDGCGICQDVAAVFVAISEDRDAAWEGAVVPPASIVWWRAQIRAREEAARMADRPIAVAQGIAVLALLAVAVVLMPIALPAVKQAIASVSQVTAWLTPRAEAVSSVFTLVTGSAVPLIPFVAAWILLAPVLLYFVLTEE
jgi:hypothetical protein